MYYDIIVIGGGASGIFYAANVARLHPELKVLVLEKSSKLLSKVKVSGGGRCNVTHAAFKSYELVNNYPRGGKKLRKLFDQFGCSDTVRWFEQRGVKLKTEEDGRIFPVTNNSQTIIDCLLDECRKFKVEIKIIERVESIKRNGNSFMLQSSKNQYQANIAFVSPGGFSKIEHYQFLAELGHKINQPVPSLFTFDIKNFELKSLAGISMPNANVRVESSKLESTGPILITHWGFSGPAILKMSAWGARQLHKLGYRFKLIVNWNENRNETSTREELNSIIEQHPNKLVNSGSFCNIPNRLWTALLEQAGIEIDRRWKELSKKQVNKLLETMIRNEYMVSGKTTFKEEFVTCGGVSLEDVDLNSMESTKCPRLFFGGEVLDIDGVTGGFNFQSAWASAYVASQSIAS